MTQLAKALFVCLAILLLSVFSAATYGQNPVYVSGGPYIYNVTNEGLVLVYDASIAIPTTGSAYTGPYFSSIAIGPDNADTDANGNALYPFVIYACDSNTNMIVRFVPAPGVSNPVSLKMDLVYNGNVEGFVPVCGRFSSTGDFYVTNQKASGGVTVYKFAGVANVKMGSLVASTPTTVSLSGLGSNAASAGITTKNTGDLLLVDHTNNAVLRAPFGTSANPFSTVSTYISGGSLNMPTGIAKLSTGEILVANTNGNSPAISDFDRTGSTAGATCPGGINFPAGAGNTSISFLASSETDVVYAATSQPPSNADFQEDLDFQPEDDNPGQVWMWTPGQGCMLASVTTSETQLFGAAVAPIPTNTVTETLNATAASPTATTFNFNSNAFQITAGGSCQAQVKAVPVDIATVEEAIILAKSHGLPNGGTPLVNLGEDGYDIAYVATWPSAGTCTSVISGGGYANAIFGLYDSTLAVNPRIVRCDSTVAADTSNEPLIGGSTTCLVLTTVGSYPLGGLIPQDTGVVGTGRGNSAFYLVNANFANGSSTTPTAIFCGFLPPVKNTSNPANASNFDGDDIIPVTFQLAKAGGNCKTGPFDNSAQALLSIAQLTPTFNYIFPLKTLPANGMFQPLGFAGLYSILLPVHANNLGLGEYSLSVLFQSGDAAQQSVVFNIVPEASIPTGQ